MKKLIALSLALAIDPAAVFAGQMAPVRPTHGLTTGIEVGLSSRKIVNRSITPASTSDEEMQSAFGRISYGLSRKVELSLRIGVSDLDYTNYSRSPGFFSHGSNEFAWGAGIAGVLYDANNWNVAGNMNYLTHNTHDYVSSTGRKSTSRASYSEWNIGLQLQGTSDWFAPYIGVKYYDAKFSSTNPNTEIVTTSSSSTANNIGAYGGVRLGLSKRWSTYLEGRFIDETAYGGGLQYSWGGRESNNPLPVQSLRTAEKAPEQTLQTPPPKTLSAGQAQSTQDSLYLNDGSIMRGRITDEKSYAITIDVAGALNEIPMVRINRVVRGGPR